MFNPKWLIGKTIAKVDMQPFPAWLNTQARYQQMAHDPVITFTDGSSIRFSTEETEVGRYGTDIFYTKGRRQ